MKACFQSCDILLPNNQDMYKWSVVACDQYTSQEDYWKDVEDIVGTSPSTLHIIYPEVYLGKDDSRITRVQNTMKEYLNRNILQTQIRDGFVLVERQTESGIRLGLVGMIDLEDYDYTPGCSAYIRATEGTIQERIPPRLRIREGALVESPHVMVLVDDKKKQLIEELYNQKEAFNCIYDTDLMKNGGHIKGYAIDGKKAKEVNELLYTMQEASNGFFLAVGDGNHSLATAKASWENIKKETNDMSHPARYAMVELVNVHNDALIFEPIHRVLFNVDTNDLYESFVVYLKENNFEYKNGNEIIFIGQGSFEITNKDGLLPVDILQRYLDAYLKKHNDVEIDYVHGQDTVENLVKKLNTSGILLGSIDKNSLFPAILAGGVLPRKTFSMGEAYEKRYYMECRKIMK